MITAKVFPSMSVIIPVYNGGEAFYKCLSSLKKNNISPLEIIIVADGDTDGSAELAAEFGAKVLRNPTSLGPATARNRGAAIAQGDIIFFIDADVTIYPDTLAKVAEVFAPESDLAALIGSYDDQPGAPNFLSQYRFPCIEDIELGYRLKAAGYSIRLCKEFRSNISSIGHPIRC